MAWSWKMVADDTKLDALIRLLNVRLPKLDASLVTLFSSIQSVNTFNSGAATPSVFGSSLWKTNNPAPVTLTNFTEGTPGQEFTLWAGDANTTVAHNANIITRGGIAFLMGANDVRKFATALGTVWREL